MKELVNRFLSEEDKREMCSWKYGGEYAIYNLPSYEEMGQRKIGFRKPESERNYHAFLEDGILVGFVNIPEEPTEVFLGIGVNPDYCGKHYGRRILMEAYRISKSLYPEKPLYLEVRTWNLRAIRCYEKTGFQINGHPYELTTGIGTGTFYRMTKQ